MMKLFFLLPLLVTVSSEYCAILNSTSVCRNILSYTNIQIINSYAEQEAQVSLHSFVWSYITPSCANRISQLMCGATYPQCATNNDSSLNLTYLCDSLCTTIPANCNSTDLDWVGKIMGQTWIDTTCPNLPSTDCVTPKSSVYIPGQVTCQPYRGTVCNNTIDYPVYTRPGFNADGIEQFLVSAEGFFSYISVQCQKLLFAFICAAYYPPCDTGVLERSFNETMPAKPPFPILPCNSLCLEFNVVCAGALNTWEELSGIRYNLNCSATGCSWLTQLIRALPLAALYNPTCPVNPSYDWPDFPTNKTLFGSIGDNITLDGSKCNYPISNHFLSVCQYPLVHPDDPSYNGALEQLWPGTQCEIPCFPYFLYQPQEWDNAQGIMYLSVPSFVLTSFLLVTWLVFPTKRKQHLVLFFIFSTWVIAFVLVFAFAASKDGDLKTLGCVDNAKPRPMNEPSWCSFQGVCLFYFSLCQSCWWLVISLDLFFSVVLERRLTPKEELKRRIKYHIFAWGLPLFFMIFFVSAGGRLGSNQISYTLFCWIYDTDTWVDYVTWLAPIGLIWLAGGTLMLAVMVQLHRVATAVTRSNSRSINFSAVSRHLRLLTFILKFFFVDFWFFLFRVYQTKYYDEVYASTFDWIACLVYNEGRLCYDRPQKLFPVTPFYCLHLAWSFQGTLLGLIWGTQRDNFTLWANLIVAGRVDETTHNSHSNKQNLKVNLDERRSTHGPDRLLTQTPHTSQAQLSRMDTESEIVPESMEPQTPSPVETEMVPQLTRPVTTEINSA